MWGAGVTVSMISEGQRHTECLEAEYAMPNLRAAGDGLNVGLRTDELTEDLDISRNWVPTVVGKHCVS